MNKQLNPRVVAICISPKQGAQMQSVQEVKAVIGKGLEGDRYCNGEGSFNKGKTGHRQVTLINGMFFPDTDFEFTECRRNIVVMDVELMWLLSQRLEEKESEFQIGEAIFRPVKYCDPCFRPSKLANKDTSFQEQFFERGGIIAEVIQGGIIRVNDKIILPHKGY